MNDIRNITSYEFIKDDYRDFWTFSEISNKPTPGIKKKIEGDSLLDELFLELGDPPILVIHILRSHAGLENPIHPNRRDILVP